jgi:hypothetical protein
MTFQKYSIKMQIILGLIFTLFNSLVSYTTQILHWPFFMDMIFVYAGSFFGLPCGLIVGLGHSIWTIFFHHNFFYFFYSICCITGVLLTKVLVTRYEDFSWIRLALLFFISTIIISLEGSIIYTVFFAEKVGDNENSTLMFLTYTLIMQNLGVQLSAFLARLPVNLIDKAIAVFGGFGIFLCSRRFVKSQKNQ